MGGDHKNQGQSANPHRKGESLEGENRLARAPRGERHQHRKHVCGKSTSHEGTTNRGGDGERRSDATPTSASPIAAPATAQNASRMVPAAIVRFG